LDKDVVIKDGGVTKAVADVVLVVRDIVKEVRNIVPVPKM
jgi:hypothetical protein